MMNKKAKKAQMPAFAWVFSLIIGAFILFFAFFFVGRLSQTSQQYGQAVYTTSLDTLLEPFTSSLASGQSDIIKLQKGTQLKAECYYDMKGRSFGKSILKARPPSMTKSQGYSFDKLVYDKYIFSRELKLGNGKLFVISMPFEMPFRIADLTMLIGDNYCFVSLPYKYNQTLWELSENVSNAGLKFQFPNSVDKCDDNTMKVCWTNDDCDVKIKGDNPGTVKFRHDANAYPWIGNMVYAAMFSDADVYNCSFKRLMLKAKTLTGLYKKQAALLGSKGCVTGLDSSLEELDGDLDNISNLDMPKLWTDAQAIDAQNRYASCKLY